MKLVFLVFRQILQFSTKTMLSLDEIHQLLPLIDIETRLKLRLVSSEWRSIIDRFNHWSMAPKFVLKIITTNMARCSFSYNSWDPYVTCSGPRDWSDLAEIFRLIKLINPKIIKLEGEIKIINMKHKMRTL